MNAEFQNTDWWLKPAQQLLSHGVAQSETAAGLCYQLEGKCLQIRVAGRELLINCLINDGAVNLFTGEADSVDAQIAGSPVSLLRLSGEDPEAVIRSGAVSVSGDAEVAENFQSLLRMTRPDWEEELSKLTGDVVAHEVGRGASMLRNWAQRAERTLSRSLGEYLSEETRAVVTETELEEFCGEVDLIASAVERAEARLRLLRERRGQ